MIGRSATRVRDWQGFTLIELLIAIALLAFLMSLASPMYSQFMANTQIRTAAETMLDGARMAQQQAIKLNTPARFVLTPATGWSAEFADEDHPGSFLQLQVYLFAEGAPKASVTAHPAGATQVTFNGLGRIVPNADASASLSWVGVTVPTSVSGSPRPLNLVIKAVDSAGTTFAGMKVCDPDTGVAVTDPRHCPALIP
jgi:type IV fimbrial biogenesis protein FimT